MFESLKNWLAPTKRKPIRRQRPAVRLGVESLEERCVPTAYTWNGSVSSSWVANGNWTDTGGTYPHTATDTVLFNASTPAQTCNYDDTTGGDVAGKVTIATGSNLTLTMQHSMTMNDMDMHSGTITASSSAYNLTIKGATAALMDGGTINTAFSASTVVLDNAVLIIQGNSAATIDNSVDVGDSTWGDGVSQLSVQGSYTQSRGITVGPNSLLSFDYYSGASSYHISDGGGSPQRILLDGGTMAAQIVHGTATVQSCSTEVPVLVNYWVHSGSSNVYGQLNVYAYNDLGVTGKSVAYTDSCGVKEIGVSSTITLGVATAEGDGHSTLDCSYGTEQLSGQLSSWNGTDELDGDLNMAGSLVVAADCTGSLFTAGEYLNLQGNLTVSDGGSITIPVNKSDGDINDLAASGSVTLAAAGAMESLYMVQFGTAGHNVSFGPFVDSGSNSFTGAFSNGISGWQGFTYTTNGVYNKTT